MPVTAAGPLAVPANALKTMLSKCTTFKKIVQAADATAALASIYLQGEEGDAARPFAVIGFDDWNPEKIGGGSQSHYAPKGVLKLMFEEQLGREAQVATGTPTTTSIPCAGLVGLPDDYFNGFTLKMLDGDAVNQEAEVSDFDGTTGTITLASALTATPAAADTFDVYADAPKVAELFFLAFVGTFMQELQDQSGLSEHLNLTAIRKEEIFRSDDTKDAKDFAYASFVCEFGV